MTYSNDGCIVGNIFDNILLMMMSPHTALIFEREKMAEIEIMVDDISFFSLKMTIYIYIYIYLFGRLFFKYF